MATGARSGALGADAPGACRHLADALGATGVTNGAGCSGLEGSTRARCRLGGPPASPFAARAGVAALLCLALACSARAGHAPESGARTPDPGAVGRGAYTDSESARPRDGAANSPGRAARPDLAVTLVALQPGSPEPCLASVRLRVRNAGDAPSTARKLALCAAGPEPPCAALLGSVLVPALPAGASHEATVPVSLCAGSTSTHVLAWIPPDPALPELRTANNRSALPRPGPLQPSGGDLRPLRLRPARDAWRLGSTPPALRPAAANAGPDPAPAGIDELRWVQGELVTKPTPLSRPLLAPGAELPLAATVPPAPAVQPGWALGTFAIHAPGDPDPADNLAAVAVFARAAPPPDLVVQELAVADPKVAAGGALELSYRVVNQGGATTARVHHAVLLSRDTAPEPGDRRLLAARTRTPMASGTSIATGTLTVAIPPDLRPGAWTLGVLVDPDDELREEREDNNAARIGLSIVGAPDLRPLALVPEHRSVTPGQSLVVRVVARNLGGGPAPSRTDLLTLRGVQGELVGTPGQYPRGPLAPGALDDYSVQVELPKSLPAKAGLRIAVGEHLLEVGLTASELVVEVDAKASYDLVPAIATAGGVELAYADKSSRPIRFAEVFAVSAEGQHLLDRGSTDAGGRFKLRVPAKTPFRLRVDARSVRVHSRAIGHCDHAAWELRVADNTSGFAGYSLLGPVLTEPNRALHLHAPVARENGRYRDRRGAPFAILDRLIEGVGALCAWRPDLRLPPLVVGWSPDNAGVPGSVEAGRIDNAHFTDTLPGGIPGAIIYLRGKEDADTDEFDAAVVLHEFGHFAEYALARLDSPGGWHGGGRVLSPELAWSEGFATALAARIRGDALYVDTSGKAQAGGFARDGRDPPAGNDRGIYSEQSVAHFLIRYAELRSASKACGSGCGALPILGPATDCMTQRPEPRSLLGFLGCLPPPAAAAPDVRALWTGTLRTPWFPTDPVQAVAAAYSVTRWLDDPSAPLLPAPFWTTRTALSRGATRRSLAASLRAPASVPNAGAMFGGRRHFLLEGDGKPVSISLVAGPQLDKCAGDRLGLRVTRVAAGGHRVVVASAGADAGPADCRVVHFESALGVMYLVSVLATAPIQETLPFQLVVY